MTIHELKTWPEPFEAVWSGAKTAEFRKADRDYGVDDVLKLREWDPETGIYSGRVVMAWVTDLRRGGTFGIPEGYCMMSFQVLGRLDCGRVVPT
jgi:hypothetical protein